MKPVKKIFFILLSISLLIACATKKNSITNNKKLLVKPQILNNAFAITEKSTDKSYGYTQKNPIKVGGVKESEGPINERRFLNALAGPNGELINYFRAGSCCHFKTENGILGTGLLDHYRIFWKGSKDTLSLYINMYDFEKLKIPVGFTSKIK
ncbi:2-dehydro-3-deoxyphosphooctonate aldolase [Polaribacter aquimarinus]|uniref:2-dehydro-3-deoxyphosphooctonate aldolase n=1 Tax=Polaribacter aquimarinus TaxID=2100726 RepID=A0A2U2J8L1_9FLAO|nr:2-dehydro-3-deoxyphosphooctonate aldolase [Polaribacter aquimarinus]PWG04611.1 2-dehydro-3-deoxyphosphooctonate aldolase [Polaribacter aquimarinus]